MMVHQAKCSKLKATLCWFISTFFVSLYAAPRFGVRGLCIQANVAAAFSVGSPAGRGAKRHQGPTVSKLATREVTHRGWKRCVTPLDFVQCRDYLNSLYSLADAFAVLTLMHVHSKFGMAVAFLCSKIWLMHFLVTSFCLYACEFWPLAAELRRRTQAMGMRCYLKILCILYKDHVTNEEVRAKI